MAESEPESESESKSSSSDDDAESVNPASEKRESGRNMRRPVRVRRKVQNKPVIVEE